MGEEFNPETKLPTDVAKPDFDLLDAEPTGPKGNDINVAFSTDKPITKEPEPEIDPDAEPKAKDPEEIPPLPGTPAKAAPKPPVADSTKAGQPPKTDAAAAVTPPVDPADPGSTTPKPIEDAEIDKFQPRPGSSPKIQNDFKVMKEGWKADRQKAKEFEGKVKELESRLSTTPDPVKEAAAVKELAAEVERLRKYEFLVIPEQSNFVTKEFDSKISKNDDGIYEILQRHGLPEKSEVKDGKETFSIESLKKLGGPNSQPLEWWEKNVFPSIPALDKRRIENALFNNEETKIERQKAIESAPAKREDYIKEQEKTAETKRTDAISAMNKRVLELLPAVPYGKVQEIPANATPEQKKEIETLNAYNKEASDLLPKLLAIEAPDKKVDLAHGFLHGAWLEREVVPSLKAKVADLEKRLADAEKLSNGLRKVSNTRSSAVPTSLSDKDKKKNESWLNKSPEEAFAALED